MVGARVTAETRLSDLIAINPRILERLAVRHPAFACLRDRPMAAQCAGLATLGELCRASRLSLDDLVSMLEDESRERIGGEGEDATAPAETSIPAWVLAFAGTVAETIDVRPILSASGEPLAAVMRLAHAVRPRGRFVIDAPFDPWPLRRLLEGRGFVTHGHRMARDHVRVFCECREGGDPPPPPATDREPLIWRADDGVHIDVRGLAAPSPMVAILRLIASDLHDGVVIVHHHREPLHLYGELVERGWSADPLPGDPGEVRLRLSRDPP